MPAARFTLLTATLAIALALLALLAPAALADGERDHWRRGDTNCSDQTDSIDAALDLQVVAGLASEVECPHAADADHDYSITSIDAVLVLQYVARLLQGINLRENPLCLPPAEKSVARASLERGADLDGDGVDELLTIVLDAGTQRFVLSEYNAVTDAYDLVLEEQFDGPASVGPAGPFPSIMLLDLTGDAKNEAVFCSSTFGANDPFADVAIFSYHGGTPRMIYSEERIPWGRIVYSYDYMYVSDRFDYLAGACEVISIDSYTWDGAMFDFTGTETIERFRSPDC
jgi:hypothetical protein